MLIKADVTLHIGQGGTLRDTLEIEVPHNWREWTADQRAELLHTEWQEWANNYIDGGITEQE